MIVAMYRLLLSSAVIALGCCALAVLVIVSVLIPVGSMFGIAHIADTYGHAWALMFIPWVLTLPIQLMPMAALFGDGVKSLRYTDEE